MTSSQDNEAPSAGGPDQAAQAKERTEAQVKTPSSDAKDTSQAPKAPIESKTNSNTPATAPATPNPTSQPITTVPAPDPASDDPQTSAAQLNSSKEATGLPSSVDNTTQPAHSGPLDATPASVGNNLNVDGALQQPLDFTNEGNGSFSVQKWLTNVDPTADGSDQSTLPMNALLGGGAADLASMANNDMPLDVPQTAAILRSMQGLEGLPQAGGMFEWNNGIDMEALNGVMEEEDAASEDAPQGFGCLELPDTVFWITTRTVLIGRDNKLWKQAREAHKYEQKCRDAAEQGLAPPEPPRSIRRNYQVSYISEEGGALGPMSDEEEEDMRPVKRRKMVNGRRQAEGGRNAVAELRAAESPHVVSSRQYLDHTPGAVPVNVANLQPSDEVVARLDIHGPSDNLWLTTKGISRDHLKIQYNFRTKIWEAHVLGRNGFFCGEVLHGMGEVVPLKSGDELQIQTVTIKFTLTGVLKGKTGAEPDSRGTYSENGKEMSFDFQSSRGDEMRDTDDSDIEMNEELNDRAVVDSDSSDESDEEMEDADISPEKVTPGEDDTGGVDDIMETVESDPIEGSVKPESVMDDAEKLALLAGLPPKKRGPGRPPKNGIMSKREERLLKKQAQEEAKKNMPPQEPGEQPQKRKVGRPRKHPLPEGADGQPEKRKYKPRKQKGEDGEEDVDGDKPTKEKSQKHKTPPLELKREDFTEEQLQKPTKNYQLLIDEIMSAAPPKGYSLKQVYKRIQERWPFFYFCVDTKGWESSVRHNLLGSECFKKIDGNWHRVPGVPLESGKKRKPSDSAADNRPTGMYNGYSHTYQPPQHHGHPPMAHSSGLSQPNLPPRYPPNGQAYQIHQGPSPPNATQPGVISHPQGPPRPGYPQHAPPGAPPQPNGFVPTGPPRPQYTGSHQHPPYNPQYANRPPPPHGAPQGPPAPGGPPIAQNPAQRPPMARPGQVPPAMAQQGIQPAPMHPAPAVQRPPPPPQQQALVQTAAPPQPLGPVIEPELVEFIRGFREEVIKQLAGKEGKRSEVVAMSVINRGLGLTERSLIPELEAYEKLILNVFQQHKKTYPKRRAEDAARAAGAAAAKAQIAPGNRPAAPTRAGLPAPSLANPAPGSVGNRPPPANMQAPAQANRAAAAPGPQGAMVNGNANFVGNTAAPRPSVSGAPPSTTPGAAGPKPSTGQVGGQPPAQAAAQPAIKATPQPTTHSATQNASPAAAKPAPQSGNHGQPARPNPQPTNSRQPENRSPSVAPPSASASAASRPLSQPQVPKSAVAASTPTTASTSSNAAPKPTAVSPSPGPVSGSGSAGPLASGTAAKVAPAVGVVSKPGAGLPAPVVSSNASTLPPKPITASTVSNASTSPATTATKAAIAGTTSNGSTGTATPAPKPASAIPTSNTPSGTAASAPKPPLVNSAPSAIANGAVAAPRPASVTPASNAAAAARTPPLKPGQTVGPPTAGMATATPATKPGPGPTIAPPATSSRTPVNGGVPRPASTTGTPHGPARATSSTPAPSTPGGADDVELLDPKLVQVILNFKRVILPTLEKKLDSLLGESLIMSAVDRLLGFTSDTFVQSKNDVQKANFAEAEKALMNHLETRFAEYVRNRDQR